MSLPSNSFRAVQTYQESSLAYLLNLACFVSTSNTKFKNFQDMTANLGDTITFDLPPRYVTTNGLTATFQDSTQRVQSLTVDQAANTSYAFNATQLLFNVDPKNYMQNFGMSAMVELANKVEADIAGLAETNTFRFYGDGATAINSQNQLAQALAYYRNFGAPKDSVKGYLSDIAVPGIVNTMLGQFVLDRNEELANSWELGRFSNCEWYQSNLLPVHLAGTIGNASTSAAQTLTVVSTNDPTGANITQITCTDSTSSLTDSNAIKKYDLGQFVDGVAGKTNVRFLTFQGHIPSASPCQISMSADAGATSGTIVLSINPGLNSTATATQNINTNIVAGMKIKIMPSHRCGLIVGGNAMYLAMPQLPPTSPYESYSKVDPDTGVSIRMYHGYMFPQNVYGMVNDCIWGKTLVPEYSMRILFPL